MINVVILVSPRIKVVEISEVSLAIFTNKMAAADTFKGCYDVNMKK